MSRLWHNTPLWKKLQRGVTTNVTRFASDRGFTFLKTFAANNGLIHLYAHEVLELFIEVETTRLYIDRMERPR